MKFLLVLTFLFTIFGFAQEKISNNDLRHLNQIISISTQEGDSFEFRKSKLDQYYLQSSVQNKITTVKIADVEFKKIDDLFVQDFISIKYMMSEKPQKCTKSYSLYMRGEVLSVCSIEKEKITKVQNLISLIKEIK